MNAKETIAPWLSLVGIGADGLDGLAIMPTAMDFIYV